MGRRRGLFLLVLGALLVSSTVAAATPTPTHVHFTAAGDWSQNTNTSGVLNAIDAANPDLSLALGDMSYGTTGTEQSWCDFVTSRVGAGYPFELVSGNHESNGANGNINDFSACLPNQIPGIVGTYGRQYYMDVPQTNPLIRFVMISPSLTFPDGTYNYSAGSTRYNWTANAIDSARNAGIPWVVVGMHKPCVSVGEKSCEPGADITNLLISKKVDLVMVGHEHGYMRTKQLALGPGCTSLTIGSYNPACVSDSDDDLFSGQGSTWVTVGNGGVPLRNINTADNEMGYFAATSGLNQNPTFGFSDVDVTPTTMSVSFVKGSGTGNFTDSFTINKGTPPPNDPPTAAFTVTPHDNVADVDASASDDTDGVITSYDWDFGDGKTGSGETTSHNYAQAGTYTVTLTVTDDDNAQDSTTHDVTVTDPPAGQVLASDGFQRTVASGWGTADVGGPWTSSAGSSVATVSGGMARHRLNAGANPNAFLGSVSSSSTDASLLFSLDKVPTGTGSMYQSTIVRRVNATNFYRGVVRITNAGAVRVSLQKTVSGTSSNLSGGAEVTVPGLTYTAGTALRVRVEADGTSPTTMRIKVWRDGTAEPAGWNLVATDSTAALQTAGAVGVISLLSSGVTNGPIVTGYDDLEVVPAG